MGCDQGVSGDHVPYCKPACKEFKLVAATWVETVRAQCVRCKLLHDFTILDGKIKIEQKKSSKQESSR